MYNISISIYICICTFLRTTPSAGKLIEWSDSKTRGPTDLQLLRHSRRIFSSANNTEKNRANGLIRKRKAAADGNQQLNDDKKTDGKWRLESCSVRSEHLFLNWIIVSNNKNNVKQFTVASYKRAARSEKNCSWTWKLSRLNRQQATFSFFPFFSFFC